MSENGKSGWDVGKLVPVMVLVLVGGAYWVGNLSAKVTLLEKGYGQGGGVGQVAGNQAGVPQQGGDVGNPPPAVIDNKKFEEIVKGGDKVMGSKNAKVAIVEFSDFQCPFCKSFVDSAGAQIKKEYIDKGKVKLVFRHFPLTAIHPYAMDAALASECAAEQGKFEAFHDKLFQNQESLAKDDLKKYAKDLGLATGKFNSCLDDAKYRSKVDEDVKVATENGINGTPGFFVDGKLVSGAQPFESFKVIIEEALKG